MTRLRRSQRLTRPSHHGGRRGQPVFVTPPSASWETEALSLAVVNLGLKAIRCIVFDDDGRTLASQSLPVHTELQSRAVEQDANEWLDRMQDVTRGVVASCGRSIDAITISTSASCLVPVDARGAPTHAVIMVSDGRAQAEASELSETTQARVTADRMLPKILWLKRHRPDVFERSRTFMSAIDYLGFHLVGESMIDTNSASKYETLRSPSGEVLYDARLLAAAGIETDRLPPIAPPGTVVGRVTPAATKRFGFPTGAQLVLGTYDALAALVGSAVCEPGTAAAVCGTVTSVRALAEDAPDELPQGILRSDWFEAERGWAILGGSNNLGGGLVEWHKQAFYADVDDDPYELMDLEAETVNPGAEGLIFLPYLLGERAPVWDAAARGVFFGIDRRHTRSHFTRAVFESVAFSTRHVREHIERAGVAVAELRFSGGLSRLGTVRQVMADVLQIPVSVPAEFETTSLGAHIMAACALGRFANINEGCRAMVSIGDRYEPRRELGELYDALFDLYRRLYLETRPLQAERERILQRFAPLLDAEASRRENL